MAVSLNRRVARLHARTARLLARVGRTPAAVRAWERAVARNPRNRRWVAALAGTYQRMGRWGDAARVWELGAAERPQSARMRAHAGRARFRAHQWQAAIDAYEAAIARNPRKPQWHAALARAREHAEHWEAEADAAGQTREEAREARRRKRARQAAQLARDPEATELDHRLAAASPGRLGTRRGIGRFVAGRLDEIRARALEPRATADLGLPVFVFWAQGFADAPPVVRRCAEETRRLHGDGDVLFLDAESVREHVQLPEAALQAVGSDWTRQSDLLRLELLSRYGGVWMDATCLPRVRIQDVVPDLLGAGFFAFTFRPHRLGNWFLAAEEPNHYLVAMLREAHYAYWESYDRLVDYFLFHHLFEVLYHLDPRFAAVWDQTPRLPVSRATAYGKSLLGPHDPARARRLLDDSFVHKLSYKVHGVRPGSGLEHLLAEGPP